MINQKLSFSIEKFDLLNEEKEDSQFATAQVLAFSSDENKHGMVCSEEILQNTAPSIYHKPILYNVNPTFDDFGTHAEPKNTLIAGFVVPNTAKFERLKDNRLGLNVLVKVWKRYAPKFMEIFSRDSNKKVSVEMDLLDYRNREDNLVEMLNFEYLGICILGDLVTEASPGANIQMVSFAKDQKEYDQAYRQEFFSSYEDVDFTIPQSVKNNVELGIKYYKQNGTGSNSVALAVARHFIKSEKTNAEKVRLAYKNLNSKKFLSMKQDEKDSLYALFMLFGGSEAKEWCGKLCETLDELDNKNLNYFNYSLITFPYQNREDMNPALKGIDPPISTSQANEIARQADAIGVDKEKNGWAIAIAKFKKTHVVRDGKWVKKERENMEDEENKDVEKKVVEESIDMENPKEEEKESPEKEQDEEKEEKKEEEEKEKMSLDANLDVKAILAMLEDETESYKAMAEQEFAKPEPNFAKICEAMFAKMCKMCDRMAKMAEDEKAYMGENMTLKEFKANVEKEQFDFQVEGTLKEISMSVQIPEDVVAQLKEDSKAFNLSNIEGWKNAAKAKAFSFATKENKKDDVMRVGTPWATDEKQAKKALWE